MANTDLHHSGTITVFNVHERVRGDYMFVIRDRDGVVVPGSTLTSAKLTLYLTSANGVPSIYVNNRQQQNVLQTNNVTIDELGLVVWDIQSEDMAIIDDKLFFEPRIAVFELIWNRGVILHEAAFQVRNIPQA